MAEMDVILPSSSAPPPWANAYANPEYYDGITIKRIFAYLIDFFIVAVLAVAVWIGLGLIGLLSLGLLLPLQAIGVALVPFAYHTLTISSARAATIGQRVMGIEIASITENWQETGGRPNFVQALILTLGFYATLALTGLLLIIMLFNSRRRALHDWVAGIVVINSAPKRGT